MSLADWFGYLYRITIYFSRHEPAESMTLTSAGLSLGPQTSGDVFLLERTQEVLCLHQNYCFQGLPNATPAHPLPGAAWPVVDIPRAQSLLRLLTLRSIYSPGPK